MARHRAHLPQLDGGIFLTDGGIETVLIFHEKLDLPHFAAFHLLKDQEGREALRNYFQTYAKIAQHDATGFVFESPTWRASRDWGDKLGYSRAALAGANRAAIALMSEVRDAFETPSSPMVISGCVGPRGDGYDPGHVMSADEAEAYHSEQIGVFAGTQADMITAITMTNVEEAIGVTRAAAAAEIPSVISFTVETDGKLPTGEDLGDAIARVDDAAATPPAYYMINCAHPTHFSHQLKSGGAWLNRLRGLRANASRLSHAELDEATTLDDGDPVELAADYFALIERLAHINVFGGCCGTDHRHIAQISAACQHTAPRRAA